MSWHCSEGGTVERELLAVHLDQEIKHCLRIDIHKISLSFPPHRAQPPANFWSDPPKDIEGNRG